MIIRRIFGWVLVFHSRAAGCNNKQASATVICINHLVHIQANPLLIALHHPAARSHQEAVIAATLQEVHQAVVLLIRAV